MAAQPSPEPLQPYRRVQGAAERDMAAILESTAKAIQKRVATLRPGIGGDIRRAQLNATLAAIKRLQRSMWTGGVAPLVARGVDDAEKAGETAIEAMTRVAYVALPEGVADVLVAGLRASAESGLKSDAARRKRELSERVYRQGVVQAGKLEELIRQGIIANLSAKELAASAYQYVSPTTPGGASYAAMRLARTEINNAFHERQLAGANRPGVKAVQWNLSGSHKVPDLCNVYAGHGGDGHWAVGEVPDKPHPQCFCFLTYITQSPAEFKRALASGSFDDEIDRRTRENMALLGQPVGGVVQPKKAPSRTPRKRAAKKEQPKSVVPLRKSNVPDNDALKKSIDSGITKRSTLSGGAIAETEKVTFKDGTFGVSKRLEDLPDDVRADMGADAKYIRNAKAGQDAEELGTMLVRAVGLNAPELVRTGPDTTVQRFMDGAPAADLRLSFAQREEFARSDEGMILGLMDQLMGNNDRNLGNWLVTRDRKIIPIDQGAAWDPYLMKNGDVSKPNLLGDDKFSEQFTSGIRGSFKWKNNDIHPGDLDRIEEILQSLVGEFANRLQLGWWQWAMDRVEAIRPYARGTKRRIP